MAPKGCYLLTYAAILLMNIFVVNSQELHTISDIVLQLSYSDVGITHLREKRDVPLDYIVILEMNVSQVVLIEEIKTSLDSISLPLQLDNNTEISSVNITTARTVMMVCVLNNTEFNCKCEDQYFWPCDKCVQYGHCDDIISTTCGCLSDMPKDGEFCQPITELTSITCSIPTDPPPADYLAEIEISTKDAAVLDDLRIFLTTLPFSMSDIQMTEINITTVCLFNNTGYQCSCEDQYLWPCEKCTQYGYCNNITTGTCGCISALPDNGPFCQPASELTSDSVCSSPPDVDECSDIPGVCGPNANCTNAIGSYNCTCQSGYNVAYPYIPVNILNPCRDVDECTDIPKVCGPHASCTNAIGSYSCTCLSGYNSKNSTVPVSIQCKEYRKTLSVKIDELFDNILTNPISQKYGTYSSDINSSVDSVYQRALSSYKAGSVVVTRFRPGSVVADFTIVTASNTLNYSAANRELAAALSAMGYNVTENSFAETVENGLHDQSKIYPGKDMVLTCDPPDSSIVEINWSVNDKSIGASSKYQISTDRRTFTVTNTSDEDNGQYACTMIFNSIPYIIWQRMVIQPLPNVRVNSSNTLYCEELPVTLACCAPDNYASIWSWLIEAPPAEPSFGCAYTDVSEEHCKKVGQIVTFICETQDSTGDLYNTVRVTVNATAKSSYCYDNQFGAGNLNDLQTGACDADSIGNVRAVCKFNTTHSFWQIVEDNCVLRALQELLDRSKNLQIADVAEFTLDLRNAAESNSAKITESDANVVTVVTLMKRIANISQSFIVDQPIMENFLRTSDVVSSKTTWRTWERLNRGNATRNLSSELLKSIEDVGKRLTDETFNISTNYTKLSRTLITGSFSEIFFIDLSTQIDIPDLNRQTLITAIVFSTLDNVLPVRNTTYNNGTNTARLNGDVAAVLVNNTVHNISLTFDIKNTSLRLPQCVFWNFSLWDGIGGWDSTGCELKPLDQTDKFKCECNHTTSFSILMSPCFLDDRILDIITYIGVSISILCLILVLIIEIIVWKPMTKKNVPYMRHVSIVNIALSLLIADICFIIGAAIVKKGEKTPLGPCSTATFFMHFFYLVLFFWMLFLALLLFYRTVMVFGKPSKSVMMVIAIALGYGAPLLIAVITVASTAGRRGYIVEENTCWLNWFKTRALLAFVIPALTIVAINLLVLIVVIYKILRRKFSATTPSDEKHALKVIARCVGFLTPLFGLTWGFGIGTMDSCDLWIHIVFAVLNSLQGFFILLFGILLDKTIRAALVEKVKNKKY